MVSIGKIVYDIFPFCDNTPPPIPGSMTTHCYESVDFTLYFLIISIALSSVLIMILRHVKKVSGKNTYWFSIGSLFITLTGFMLLGVTPHVFIIGVVSLLLSLLITTVKYLKDIKK